MCVISMPSIICGCVFMKNSDDQRDACMIRCNSIHTCVYYSHSSGVCYLCVASGDEILANDDLVTPATGLPAGNHVHVKDGIQYEIFPTENCNNMHPSSNAGSTQLRVEKIARLQLCYGNDIGGYSGFRLYDQNLNRLSQRGACVVDTDESRTLEINFDDDEFVLSFVTYFNPVNLYGTWYTLWIDYTIHTNRATHGPIGVIYSSYDHYIDLGYNLVGFSFSSGQGIVRVGANYERC